MPKIEDFFTSFTTTTAKASSTLARVLDTGSNQRIPEELIDSFFMLMYPKAPGELKPISEILKWMEQNAAGGDDAKAQILKLLRLYSVSFKSNDNAIEAKIAKFYTEGSINRKSAYRPLDYGGVASAEPKITAFSELIKGGIEMQSPVGPSAPTLSFILIDAPAIDIRFRSADKVEAFLNYVPSFVASQLTPYLEAQFTFNRNIEDTSTKSLLGMSPLRFLLNDTEVDQKKIADFAMYDASRKVMKATTPDPNGGSEKVNNDSAFIQRSQGQAREKAVEEASKKAAEDAAKTSKVGVPPTFDPKTGLNSQVSKFKSATQITSTSVISTGMELFTMPQTLINMDYQIGSSNRYNPIINPTLPFGAITGLTVDVRTNVGMSGGFKTAQLTLKVFDRSRVSEIADFISPALYKSVTIWLTYGWRAPVLDPAIGNGPNVVKTYYDFINENMLKREAYGIQNTSISIDKDGVTTIVLSLFTRGAVEFVTARDGLAGEFESRLKSFDNMQAELRVLAKRMGLQSVVAATNDIRGATIISSALAGQTATIDSSALRNELKGLETLIKEGNFGEDGEKFIKLVSSFYVATGNSSTTARAVAERIEARGQAAARFSDVKSATESDLFAAPTKGNTKAKYESDNYFQKNEDSPLARAAIQVSKNKQFTIATNEARAEAAAGREFGSVSFGRVFGKYFAQIANSMVSSSTVDEIQVVFYNLNKYAGACSSINIAEFPIEVTTLEEAYAQKLVEQKGENLSFSMLVEVIRESQFNNVQHPAYGFRDLYKQENGKIVLKDFPSIGELAKRTASNFGNGGPFTLPTIEFFIETGYTSVPSGYNADDLLNQFELASKTTTANQINSTRKIMRVHIYDKAAMPAPALTQILTNPNGGLVSMNVSELKKLFADPNKKLPEQLKALLENNRSGLQVEQIKKTIKDHFGDKVSDQTLDGLFTQISFKDENGKSSFEKVKQIITEAVPTIKIGANGSMVENASFSTQQDALLSTVFMRRNNQGISSPSQPNGSGMGDLPMRVIPGAVSMTTFGCPVLEYMQTFFVDLGTGTTIDNMYNVTGLTHTLSPGKFTTQIKFTFGDAYGRYEDPQSISTGIATEVQLYSKELEDKKKQENSPKSPPAKAKSK